MTVCLMFLRTKPHQIGFYGIIIRVLLVHGQQFPVVELEVKDSSHAGLAHLHETTYIERHV